MSRTDDPIHSERSENSDALPIHKEGLTIKDYHLIARIGEGSFGEVYKAERGGVEVALKILKKSVRTKETKKALKSLETLKKLNHRFLLPTRNFWSDGDQLFIEMELADGGTLKERLKAYKDAGKWGIPGDELLKYFSETALALDYLHGRRPVVLHRDIKPANIVLVRGTAKLADFDLIREVAGDNCGTQTEGGTFPYMAPESIENDEFSVYSDLFSFAVTYAELRQGELPFPGKNQIQIYEKMKKPPQLSPTIFHPEEKKVVLKALEKDPYQRYASCGEFVLELNRVVPWAQAVGVPPLPTPPRSGDASTYTTDLNLPEVEKPTDHKVQPKTMPDCELPATEAQVPAPATLSKDDGTVVSGKAKRQPRPTAEPPSPQPIPDSGPKGTPSAPAPVAKTKPGQGPEKKEVKPAWKPVPRRRRTAVRTMLRILLWAAIGGIVTGIWFFLKMDAEDEVRGLIEKEEFHTAWKTIQDRPWLFLPNELKEAVEKNWCAKVKEAELDRADLKALNEFRSELDKFEMAFPRNDDIKPRRQLILDYTDRAVSKAEVRKFIEIEDFSAAWKTIQNKRGLLSLPEKLEKEVEEKWWGTLNEPELKRWNVERLKELLTKLAEFKAAFPQKNEGIEQRRKEVEGIWWAKLKNAEPDLEKLPTLKEFLTDLAEFKEAFPEKNDPIQKRRDEVLVNLTAAVSKKVDQSLIAGAIDAAGALVADNKEFLTEKGVTLFAKIADKRTVLDLLAKADAEFKKRDFEKCLTFIKKAKPAFEKDSIDQKRIQDLAESGIRSRDESHARLLDDLNKLFDSKEPFQEKLGDLKKFRDGYPKTDWRPELGKYDPALVLNELLVEAWNSLLKDTVVPTKCRERLGKVKEHAKYVNFDPITIKNVHKNVRFLEALVEAHEAGKESWGKAIEPLIQLVNEKERGDLNLKLWQGLAQLEKNTKQFRFRNLDDLELAWQNLPNGEQENVSEANSQILGHALERLLKEHDYQWFPSKAESSKCATWCGRIDGPSSYINALKAECSAESGVNLEEAKKIVFPADADWYVSYAHALVLKEKKEDEKGAEILMKVLQKNPKVLKPQERSRRAANMLWTTARSLPRSGKNSKEFKDPGDAKKAIRWLTMAFDLLDEPQAEPALEDLIELAVAIAKSGDKDFRTFLKRVDDRLVKGKFGDAAKGKGYYGLAQAYRAEGKSHKDAFDYFEKALQDKEPANDDLRRLAATEAAEYALQMAQNNRDSKKWDLAIENSQIGRDFAYKLGNMDLETGARLNRDAVRIHALAVSNKSAQGKKGEKEYEVYQQALKKADELPISLKDGFRVPIIIAKLEFASTTYWWPPSLLKTDFPIEHLDATVAEGKIALDRIKELAKEAKDKQKKTWWEILHSKGAVKLADARIGLFAKNQSRDFAELRNILKEYEDVKAKNYHEKWNGELSYKIGDIYWIICNQKGNDMAQKKDEAKRADDAFTESRKSLGMIPKAEVTAEIELVERNIPNKYEDKEFRKLLGR